MFFYRWNRKKRKEKIYICIFICPKENEYRFVIYEKKYASIHIYTFALLKRFNKFPIKKNIMSAGLLECQEDRDHRDRELSHLRRFVRT